MLSGIVTMCVGVLMQASPVAVSETPTDWLDSYGQAMKVAKQDHRMMLVYFHKDELEKEKDALYQKLTTDAKLHPYVEKHVLVRIPMSQRAVVGGKEIQLLQHSSFAELEGQAGIAIIDFEDPKSEYYGHVVECLPADPARRHDDTAPHCFVESAVRLVDPANTDPGRPAPPGESRQHGWHIPDDARQGNRECFALPGADHQSGTS